MTTKTKEKRRAREIQKRTGWSYSECLRCASMTDEALEALILLRKTKGEEP